ncbi:MAG: hypothetical protein CL705_00490 [Chloroflexi bacterium]|nr:hypothetical protein [Chloroflexota bacterium]
MGRIIKYIFVISLFLFFTPQLSVQADQFEIKDDLIQFFDKPTLDGRMVFSVKLKDKGNHDLWIMDADGSNIRHLTDTDYNEVDPTISPDGRYVAFAHDREGDWRIGIMTIDNPDPNDPWPITFYDDQRHPDWGDNGLIVFQSNQEGKWSIWSKDPFMKGDLYGQDLKEESNLMVQDGVEVENDIKRPSYSKDGKYLAFATNRDGPYGADNRINRIWIKDRQTGKSNEISRGMVKQGDDPEFYKGRSWYPNANGLPVIAFVQIKDGRPTIRWTNLDGSGGGRLTDKMPGNVAAKGPKFGPERSQEVLAFLMETSPDYWQIATMDIHRGQDMPPFNVTPPSMDASISSFDWGPFPEKNTRTGSKGTKMNPGGTKNNLSDFDEERRIKQNEFNNEMSDLDEERRIKQNELENEMRRLEEEQRREREKMEMEFRNRQDLSREEENRLRQEMDMEMERERLEMERERMEMDMEMERERMEQQREMMRNMDGDGGRDDFFEPDERCFIENEEESRGLFGNIEIGSEIDCNETQGMQDRLRDPTTLAMLGLVVTVGATMLQMLRGN